MSSHDGKVGTEKSRRRYHDLITALLLTASPTLANLSASTLKSDQWSI